MSGDALGANEDFLPPEVDAPAIPKKLDQLAPWHRPRKQFVRRSQWAKYAVDLVNRVVTPANDDRLKYLTLPGLDYFDVEVIAEATRELGIAIDLTAFQNQATKPEVQARCHIRTESLVKRGLVRDTAVTLPYSIEDIVHSSSQAARSLRRRGPFDVINLDACGSLAHPSREPKLIQVLHKLVELQQNQSRRRWLLFVTVDIRKEDTDEDTLVQLSQGLQRNIDRSTTFSDKFVEMSERFLWSSPKSLHEDELQRDSFLRKAALALSKWLIHLGEESSWAVNCKTQYCYSTDGQDPDSPTMVCLAFEFIPLPMPLSDPLSIGVPTSDEVAGPDYHLKAAEKIEQLENLDLRMQQRDTLRREMAQEQLELLNQAGYTAEAQDEYRARYLG